MTFRHTLSVYFIFLLLLLLNIVTSRFFHNRKLYYFRQSKAKISAFSYQV